MKRQLLSFSLLLVSLTILMSFGLPKNISKMLSKEIKAVYKIENFTLEEIVISEEIKKQLQTKITTENLFKIKQKDTLIGYAYMDKAPSKTDEFDYLLLFDSNLTIQKAKVLLYREDYGSEIGSKRWLRQFIGKKKGEKLQYEKDIIAISGATISARSMTLAISNVLQSLEVLQQKNSL